VRCSTGLDFRGLGVSDNNRKANTTPYKAGKRQVKAERSNWHRLAAWIGRCWRSPRRALDERAAANLARLVSFFRKQELDRDFDQELSAHIELATQDHVRQGMTLPEARRLAIIQLVGLSLRRNCTRFAGLPALDGILQDVRFAFQRLAAQPGFASRHCNACHRIGVNAAVFTVRKRRC